MKLTIGLQQTIVTVQRSKEQATIGLCWSEYFVFSFYCKHKHYVGQNILYFPFIANISIKQCHHV